MKATLDLPQELMLEAKLRAVSQGIALKDLIAGFIRQGLGMSPAVVPYKSDRVFVDADGFPTFIGSPGSPASRMTLQELLDLEQAALTELDLVHAGLKPAE